MSPDMAICLFHRASHVAKWANWRKLRRVGAARGRLAFSHLGGCAANVSFEGAIEAGFRGEPCVEGDAKDVS